MTSSIDAPQNDYTLQVPYDWKLTRLLVGRCVSGFFVMRINQIFYFKDGAA